MADRGHARFVCLYKPKTKSAVRFIFTKLGSDLGCVWTGIYFSNDRFVLNNVQNQNKIRRFIWVYIFSFKIKLTALSRVNVNVVYTTIGIF